MDFNQETRIFKNIFIPGYIKSLEKIERKNKRFVYYTSAEVVSSILKERKIWLRNATTMNDFSEIGYGVGFVDEVLRTAVETGFKDVINNIFPNTFEQIVNLIDRWKLDWKYETYIACISKHRRKEDFDGRLSMWRAYGNTAMVIKNTPLVQVTDRLSVYGAPVRYLDWDEYWKTVETVMLAIKENRSFLESRDQDYLIDGINRLFLITAITTKHPGFREEREWRIYYRPSDAKLHHKQSLLKSEQVVVKGVPQKVFKLPLEHVPEMDLFYADIPSLLDRIIIGPTEYPYVTANSYRDILEELGVKNIDDKIHISRIPLRTQ